MNPRALAVNLLYEIASAITTFADSISPRTDAIWRERRWKQQLRRQAILDSYELPEYDRDERAAHHCEYADPTQCSWPGHRR